VIYANDLGDLIWFQSYCWQLKLYFNDSISFKLGPKLALQLRTLKEGLFGSSMQKMQHHWNLSGTNQFTQFKNSDIFDIHFKGIILLLIIVVLTQHSCSLCVA